MEKEKFYWLIIKLIISIKEVNKKRVKPFKLKVGKNY